MRRNRNRATPKVEFLEDRTAPAVASTSSNLVARDDVVDTDAGNPVVVHVLGNDGDPSVGLNPASVRVTTPPTHGTIASINAANGDITYTPFADYSGSDSFAYTVSNNQGVAASSATVTVIVNRPTANDDFATTVGTQPVTLDLPENDTDPEGNDRLVESTLAIVTAPGHGTAVITSPGHVTYTANAGFTGTDTFQYTIQDVANATSNAATVSITVLPPGGTLADDSADTDAGNAVTLDVLANDGAASGFNAATLAVSAAPAHGTAVASNGLIVYTPVDQFSGTDTFQYTVRDANNVLLGPATVTVIVNRPTANDDFATTVGTQPVTLDLPENDTDPEGNDRLVESSILFVTPPSHGTAVISSPGHVTYTANADFTGTDTFQYTIKDVANATSNVATVTIAVVSSGAINDDSADTDAGNAVTLDVLANDSDPNGFNPGTLAIVSGPTHGTAVVNDGKFIYTPVDQFSGTDTFTYQVQNTFGTLLGPATVTVVVNRPTANDDFATTVGTQPVTLDLPENDTDPEGNDRLVESSILIVTPPSHGTVLLTSPGHVTYTAAAGFTGTDTFQYTIQDVANATSNAATVSITVLPPGGTLADDSADTDAGNAVTLNVLANDGAASGFNAATLAVTVASAHGTAVVNAGKVVYTPVDQFSGTDTFQYTVRDANNVLLGPATVTVIVNRPTANDDFAQASGSTPVTLDLPENDTDPEGNNRLVESSILIVTPPSHGTAVISSPGHVTYTANADFTGTDTFQYTIKDVANATSNVATVAIVVSRPTAVNAVLTTIGTTPTTFNVLSSANAPGGSGSLSGGGVRIVTPPSHGTVAVNASTGQLTYTANPGYLGADSFAYTLTDASGAVSRPAQIRVEAVAAAAPVVVPVRVGNSIVLQVLDPVTRAVKFTLAPFGARFLGNYLVAVGDVNGDGTPDIVIATRKKGGRLRVIDGQTGQFMAGQFGNLLPFGRTYAAGLLAVLSDFNRDGFKDVVVRGVVNGRAKAKVYDGRTGAFLSNVPGNLSGLPAEQVDAAFAAAERKRS